MFQFLALFQCSLCVTLSYSFNWPGRIVEFVILQVNHAMPTTDPKVIPIQILVVSFLIVMSQLFLFNHLSLLN